MLGECKSCGIHTEFIIKELCEVCTKDKENQTMKCKIEGCNNHVPSTNESPYCGLHMGEGLRMTSLLTVHDYEQCLIAQSACNATGIIYSMSELRERIWNTARQHNKATEWVNTHPILQLYAYQLAHLCHNREPIEWTGYSEAYQFCKDVVEKRCIPEFDYTLGNPDENSHTMREYRMI